MDLNTTWFCILGFLLTGFVVLGGYDLGIGVLHLFTKDKSKRKAYLAMVGPYWDGNEVWLIVFGATLFAAFPPVYAVIFSGFYIQLFLIFLPSFSGT
jgi:cytochrome d ubiquinol oxidase subunit II